MGHYTLSAFINAHFILQYVATAWTNHGEISKTLADKTLADWLSTAKSAKVFSCQCFVLYGSIPLLRANLLMTRTDGFSALYSRLCFKFDARYQNLFYSHRKKLL